MDSYLKRALAVLAASESDIPAMRPAAEAVAALLARGGRLLASGAPGLVSEVTSRAGGFMMIRSAAKLLPGPGDVLLHFPAGDPDKAGTAPGKADLLIALGAEAGAAPHAFPHHAGAGNLSPTLAATVVAWLFTGEMIAALTRIGKMPVIYESIGAYGGHPRIEKYKRGEIAFHAEATVPPLEAGELARRFAATVRSMIERVEREQGRQLATAGEWARQAKAGGHRLFMYSMGHLIPREIGDGDMARVFRTGAWNAGFRGQAIADDPFQKGDFVVHVGYQHPPDELLRRARAAGARAVYLALREDRDFTGDAGVLWIDPMWDWADACVMIEGYDVPVLPASGIVNAAIAWELHRQALATGHVGR